MKIIKLNYDYSYIIEQILDEHQYFVMKIIEIYNGKLISCSGDKCGFWVIYALAL